MRHGTKAEATPVRVSLQLRQNEAPSRADDAEVVEIVRYWVQSFSRGRECHSFSFAELNDYCMRSCGAHVQASALGALLASGELAIVDSAPQQGRPITASTRLRIRRLAKIPE